MPPVEIDSSVLRRLEDEKLMWLTTVTSDGTPQSSLVWFLWEGGSVLVYSRESSRVRNLTTADRVAFNFNSNERGGAVATFTGAARIDRTVASAAENPAYVEKYEVEISRIGHTPESFSEAYPVPIVIELESVRAWGN